MDERESILKQLDISSGSDTSEKSGVKSSRQQPMQERDAIKLFSERIQSVGGLCIPASEKSIAEQLEMLLKISGKVFIANDHELEKYDLSQWKSTDNILEAETGVTSCDGLIAETGTIVICHGKFSRRSASLLPSRHIVIASKRKLYQNMEEFFRYWAIGNEEWPANLSSMIFITGPSRTADIEKILIQGMHGPRELIVILVED